jgi:ABC-type branched-subunit amino acid transport system substrate-binding protein
LASFTACSDDDGSEVDSGAQAGSSTSTASAGSSASTVAAGSSVGVTETSIRISVSGAFSGPPADFVNKFYTNGLEVWQKEINAAGGIFGRQIELVKVDNQLTPDGAVAACKEVESNGSFMNFIIVSPGDTEVDCEDAAGIPVVYQSASALKPWKNVLVVSSHAASAPTQVSMLKSSYMNAGDKKIGIFYTGDLTQLDLSYKAHVAELEKQGLNLVHSEKVTLNQTSFVPEMSRMKDAGAEVVMLITGFEASGIVRDATAIGYTPEWFATATFASSDAQAKAIGEAYLGVRGARFQTTSDTAVFAAFLEKVRKTGGDAASADTTDAQVYAFADVMGEMLRLAGPDLTRPGFVAAAKTIENYTGELELLGPFTLKDRQVGLLAEFPVECCNSDNTFKSLGPAKESF